MAPPELGIGVGLAETIGAACDTAGKDSDDVGRITVPEGAPAGRNNTLEIGDRGSTGVTEVGERGITTAGEVITGVGVGVASTDALPKAIGAEVTAVTL